MASELTHIVLSCLVCTAAFEDFIYVYGQGNQEMLEHGRTQYKLLKERGSLPKYGSCWKTAIAHLDEGCRQLSEDTQSDIALHITNCFLEMSGHATYNCELDKKQNLRAICINSMSDRAFNVYTEFYTHTQNICWFLRGQIWHETIVENTIKVGKQLEVTAENQEYFLKVQTESLELQEKMIKHGRYLEQVLEELYVSSRSHQEILQVLSQTIANLQNWIIGEVSWIDSIMFYSMAIILTFLLTSTERTVTARLPIFCLLFSNLVIERLICAKVISSSEQLINIHSMYINIYDFIWYSRYGFVFIASCIYIYKVLIHKNILSRNNELLCDIVNQNNSILSLLDNLKSHFSPNNSNINIIDENKSKNIDSKYKYLENDNGSCTSDSIRRKYHGNSDLKENVDITAKIILPFDEIQNTRYFLRSGSSRQSTPDPTNVGYKM